jgi:predicted RND superfamily exporter protein
LTMKPFFNRMRVCGPLLLMLGSAPLVIWGALSVPSNTADVTQWLPDGNQEKQDYLDFVATFGADNFVLVSWPGCTLEDDRLDDFALALEQRAAALNDRDAPLLRRVLTARGVLAELTGDPLRLPREVAIQRMQGTLVGPDGATSAMLIQLDSGARNDQHTLVDMIFDVAPQCGLAPDTLRLGGTAYKAVMIERESEQSLRRFAVPSCLVALVVAWCCLRNMCLTNIVLAGAVFAELLSLALVYYTGGKLNAVMIVMPPLIFVLTVSGSVHLINYYRDAVGQRGVDCPARHAVGIGWLPCTLASVTTAIGLISLGVSAIAPVRMFGLYAGIALLASLLAMLTFLPAALRMWPPKYAADSSRRVAARHVLARRRADRAGAWLCGQHPLLVAGSLIVIVALGSGLTRLTTSVNLERSFRESSRFLRDYRWIEEHIGPLISVEVVVCFDGQCPLTGIERMELMAQVHGGVSHVKHAGGVLSPVTFSPPIPARGGLRQTTKRAVFSSKLEELRPELLDKGLLAEVKGSELWRLSARAPAMGQVHYGHFIQQVGRPVQAVIGQYREAGIGGIGVSYTGLSPLIDRAQQQLLDDLVKSFLIACLLICPIMMVVLRSFWGGLLAMIPNIVPAVTVFGALGWLSIPLDIGTVLTASVALGIAVDDTLHFLTWYSRALGDGLPRVDAIRRAYSRCATAMIQTTLVCGLGLLVFALSSYTPASRFAWLIGVLLLTALGGDLILLPAILASPLGRAFEPKKARVPLERWWRLVPEAA